MQWSKYIWHFQNCATWSHTCTLALSGFGGILVLFQIAAQTGASVTCWWPDWHVWHKIRARGDNVVFGLGWASWVRRFIYMLNEGQCSKGRVHIGFCTKQCLGSGGANPPWLPIVAPPIGAFTMHYALYCIYTLCAWLPPTPIGAFPLLCNLLQPSVSTLSNLDCLSAWISRAINFEDPTKVKPMISRTTFNHIETFVVYCSTTNWSKGLQREARSS